MNVNACRRGVDHTAQLKLLSVSEIRKFMMTSPSEVSTTRESGSTSTICVDRPRALNALTLEMVQAIYEVYKQMITTSKIPQVVVVKGSGGKVSPCNRAECAHGRAYSMFELRPLPCKHALSR